MSAKLRFAVMARDGPIRKQSFPRKCVPKLELGNEGEVCNTIREIIR